MSSYHGLLHATGVGASDQPSHYHLHWCLPLLPLRFGAAAAADDDVAADVADDDVAAADDVADDDVAAAADVADAAAADDDDVAGCILTRL
jgi:hypothetical protein